MKRRIRAGSVALLFLFGCASGEIDPASFEPSRSVTREEAPSPRLPVAVKEGESSTFPCGKIEELRFDGGSFFYSLPCRRFDRFADSPDPAP